MMPGLSVVIRDALQSVEAVESVERVKDAVTDVLLLTDPAVKVFRTHFFNHTYSPDFVLEWPSDHAQTPRPVYLRSTNNPEVLREDLELVDAKDCMFVQLFAGADREVTPSERQTTVLLEQEAKATQNFVTQTESLEILADARSDSTGVKLYASSVVRGGRGLLERGRASDFASAVGAGFQGAVAKNRDQTAAAVTAIDTSLDVEESRRLKNVLQAVWVSSGSSAMDFPSDELDLSSRLSSESLAYLLNIGGVDDAAFWLRLSRNVDLDLLQELNQVGETQAFQQLMRSSTARLQVKSATVRSNRTRLDEADSAFRWSVENGVPTLRGHGSQIWFAQSAKRLELPHSERPELPSAAEVNDRARRSDLTLDQLEATNGSERLSFSSETAGNLADVSDFSFIDEALGSDAVIRRAAVRAENQHINANFEPGTATTNGRGKVAIGTMAWCALSMLVSLSPSARSELDAVRPDPTPVEIDDEQVIDERLSPL